LVDNERHRCRRFEEGLKPSIRNFVAAVSYTTYKGCYEGALKVEGSLFSQQQIRDTRKSRSAGQSGSSMPSVQSSKGDLVRVTRDDSGAGSSGGSKKKKRG
ncbi:hypothetical protein, partial [Klebsiella pneumoniae]|uniref:hypothetical protein n=1 Tax=Klebsiella pneumoniae TaxID=573 RepID=UPI001D0F1754